MNKKLLISTFCCIVAQFIFSQNAVAQSRTLLSEMFYYEAGSQILKTDFADNNQALNRLGNTVNENRSALNCGMAYFEIFSYIPSWKVGDVMAINEASIEASIVRAHLKTKFGVKDSQCLFMIDTTQNFQYAVKLQLVEGKMPSGVNRQISYSLNTTYSAANSAVDKYYYGVPYVSYPMYMAKRDYGTTQGGELTELFASTTTAKEVEEVVEETPAIEEPTVTPAPKEETQAEVCYFEERPVEKSLYGAAGRPFFGLKTNLLYWAVAIPNLGAEFYIGSTLSLGVEGSYTCLNSFLETNQAYYQWSGTAKMKFWFNGDKQFDGFYLGLYGTTGTYNFKLSNEGHQGTYFAAGVTCGYLLPISNHFNMEFGLSGGYLQYRDEHYKWDGTEHVYVDPNKPINENWCIFPTSAEVSLVWKF